jgi:hypothetical protein
MPDETSRPTAPRRAGGPLWDGALGSTATRLNAGDPVRRGRGLLIPGVLRADARREQRNRGQRNRGQRAGEERQP